MLRLIYPASFREMNQFRISISRDQINLSITQDLRLIKGKGEIKLFYKKG